MSLFFPQKILFCVAIEGGFLPPADAEEGLADGGFGIRGDGTLGAVIFVVAFMGENADDARFDGVSFIFFVRCTRI